MVYKGYDEAIGDIVTSNADFKSIVYIRDRFTQARVENVLSKVDIAKVMDISEQKATNIVKRMVDVELLMRVSRGIYRLNPFMYVPYRADGATLQREWNELLKTQRHLAIYKDLKINDRQLDPIVEVKPSNEKVVETHPHIDVYNSLKTEYVRTRFKDMMDKGTNMSKQFLSYATKMDEGIYKKEKENK